MIRFKVSLAALGEDPTKLEHKVEGGRFLIFGQPDACLAYRRLRRKCVVAFGIDLARQ